MGHVDDRELTLVLVGRTGNGKSATGNSILGKKEEFLSKASACGVTAASELRRTVLKNGLMLNVIDTPGLFDACMDSEFIEKEIVRCMSMVKDGIHAFLVVLSVWNRFTQEEANVFSSLRKLFGNKINDYMIVVHTGGDELEENEQTLEDLLEDSRPGPILELLKETLRQCGNRCVVFDNKTKDERKKTQQTQQLLSLVNTVLTNTHKPYTLETLSELKFESRLKETTIRHEQFVEEMAHTAQTKSNDKP